ncbi:MAG TPA: hypothetical protein DDW16_03375 [Clostridiales bacterium]|nr:hypothetical protein [Clostridiales bacterium]
MLRLIIKKSIKISFSFFYLRKNAFFNFYYYILNNIISQLANAIIFYNKILVFNRDLTFLKK